MVDGEIWKLTHNYPCYPFQSQNSHLEGMVKLFISLAKESALAVFLWLSDEAFLFQNNPRNLYLDGSRYFGLFRKGKT